MSKENKTISLTLDEIEQVLDLTPLSRAEINNALVVIEEGNEAKENNEFEKYLKFAEKRLKLVNDIYEVIKEVLEGKEEEENEEINS